MMVTTAAAALENDDVCLVGIGLPSEACNLARLTHAPGITLIYESGPIATQPDVLPLSIGDGVLSDSALTTVPITELFGYWLQGGRTSVGFLGAAQIDKHANLNTTVIGDYEHPNVRLPGGGGAPEIATHCGRVVITMPHSTRGMVPDLDFTTTLGFGKDGRERQRLGLTTEGPTLVVTDLCTMRPGQGNELEVVSLHPGVTRQQATRATGWPLRFAEDVSVTPPPSHTALATLRDLRARTAVAHDA